MTSSEQTETETGTKLGETETGTKLGETETGTKLGEITVMEQIELNKKQIKEITHKGGDLCNQITQSHTTIGDLENLIRKQTKKNEELIIQLETKGSSTNDSSAKLQKKMDTYKELDWELQDLTKQIKYLLFQANQQEKIYIYLKNRLKI